MYIHILIAHLQVAEACDVTSASAIVGGGFFGGLLLGYALKKVVKVVAVIGTAQAYYYLNESRDNGLNSKGFLGHSHIKFK
jgi:uncharacterized membrane protein (Fun14 family)